MSRRSRTGLLLQPAPTPELVPTEVEQVRVDPDLPHERIGVLALEEPERAPVPDHQPPEAIVAPAWRCEGVAQA